MAADALTKLKEGGVIAKDSVDAHQNFYLNLIEAKNSAEAVNGMELLNRTSSIIEVLHARLPHHAEKFIERCNNAASFDKLLGFIQSRITILKSLQLPQKEKTQTIKIHATETREVKYKQFGPKTFAQELSTSPKNRTNRKWNDAAYAKALIHLSSAIVSSQRR